MIRFIRALLALSVIASGAYAQQLTVRSGDHPTFSRITFPLAASQTWSAARTPQGIDVTVSNQEARFDTSKVFTRIRRDRIAAVEAVPGSLTLHFGCDCNASAFRIANLLVIDVVDPGVQLSGTPITASAGEDSNPPRKKRASPLRSNLRQTTILPWIGSTPLFSQTSEISKHSPSAGHLENPLTTPPPIDRDALLRQVGNSLASEIAAATSLGLLESNYSAPQVAVPPESNPTEHDSVLPRPLPSTLGIGQENMRVTSSMDRPTGAHPMPNDATVSGLTCPDDDFVTVESWGNDTSFSAQIGAARQTLVNARDRMDSTAVVQLAKLYIFFGFGAEALDTLKLEQDLIKENAHLAAVATILERGGLTGNNPLAPYTDCNSDIALWASLSFKELPPGLTINTKAALRALNKLPKHLRQVVAPSISDRFLQHKDAPAAAAALRSIERLPDAMTPDGSMAQAVLAIETGAPAEAILEDVIEANSPQSPEALVRLVERKLAQDEPLSYETATLVEAYAQELRGTEMGRQLRKTQVIALSQSARFDEAFAALDALSGSISAQSVQDLRRTVLEQLTRKASDASFLEHYFAHQDDRISRLPDSTKLMLASRLMDLGFAAQVQTLLDAIDDRPRSTERQLLAARAALTLQQPFQAQAALVEIEGAEAARMMAQAKELTGSYGEAAEIYAALNDDEKAAEAAWLSEDWQNLTRPDTPGLGPVAARAVAGGPAPDPEAGPLGRADSALGESRALRDALEDLLSAPVIRITPDS